MAALDADGQTVDTARLVQHVKTDPDLTPVEQQTTISWCGDDECAEVYTEERGMVLSILRSPVATVHELRVSDEDRFGAIVAPDEYETGAVTGVKASVPIGAIKIKSQARSTNRRGQVVSDHDPDGEASD